MLIAHVRAVAPAGGMEGAGQHHDENGPGDADPAADPIEILKDPGHIEKDRDGH